jgi:hypothetical protein
MKDKVNAFWDTAKQVSKKIKLRLDFIKFSRDAFHSMKVVQQ